MFVRVAALMLVFACADPGVPARSDAQDARDAGTSEPADANDSDPVIEFWPPIAEGEVSCHLRLRSREVCHVPGWVRAPGIGPSITSLAAFSETEIWGVDESGALLFWDGVAFSGGLRSDGRAYRWVWGLGASDVWAVGDAGLASHWDGTTLTDVELPTTGPVTRVHGSASSDVWFVADGVLVQWDGRTVTPMPLGEEEISDVLAFAPNEAWAVSQEALFRWDGKGWRDTHATIEEEVDAGGDPLMVTRPVGGTTLRGTSSNALWVDTLHFDGHRWTRRWEPSGSLPSWPVLSTTSDDGLLLVLAVGDWDVDYFSLHVTASGSSAPIQCPRLDALATLPDGRIVAARGARLGEFDDGEWSGADDQDVPRVRPDSPCDSSRRDELCLLTETGWRRELVPSESFTHEQANALGTLLVVSKEGAILVHRGGGWEALPSPTARLMHVRLLPDDGIVVLDDGGVSWLRVGSDWQLLRLPGRASSVVGSGLSDLVFAGSPGWHWDGASFQMLRFPRMTYEGGEWLAVEHDALLQRRGTP